MAYEVPNHTQTPNVLFDEHMRKLSGAELKVVLAICRKTFGWHKVRDKISTAQLMELTGLSNRTIIDTVRKLIKRKMIARRQIGQSFEYALILSAYEKSSQVALLKSSQARRGRGSEKSSHTKEKRNKLISLIKENKNYMDDPFVNYIED